MPKVNKLEGEDQSPSPRFVPMAMRQKAELKFTMDDNG